MTMSETAKYAVFKLTDAEGVDIQCEAHTVFYATDALPDAVVIRTQDVFAEHGLRAYAGAVITAMDIIRKYGIPGTEAELAHLQSLADYFNDQADAASLLTGKVPD